MSEIAHAKATAYAARAQMLVNATKAVTDSITLTLMIQAAGILCSTVYFIAGLIWLAIALA